MPQTRNLAEHIKAKLSKDPALAELVEGEAVNSDIAQQIYDLRAEAGLTQKELADRIDTQQSVISRTEDADYDGHSLDLLKRIAFVFRKKLILEFRDI